MSFSLKNFFRLVSSKFTCHHHQHHHHYHQHYHPHHPHHPRHHLHHHNLHQPSPQHTHHHHHQDSRAVVLAESTKCRRPSDNPDCPHSWWPPPTLCKLHFCIFFIILSYSTLDCENFRLHLSVSTDHTQNAGMRASNVSLQISVLFKRKVASDIIYLTWLPESRVALGVHRGRADQENERGLFANHSC